MYALRSMFVSVIVLFSTLFQTAFAADASNDRYPLPDPLMATITAAANHPTVPFKILNIEPMPSRRNTPLLEGQNIIPITVFENANPKAPVVFLLSGIGGSALSGTAMMLAGELSQQGYTAITLPDPVNWQYALGVSRSARPGYLPNDVAEYYSFVKFALRQVEKQEGIRPTHFALVGYSYGALLTGYLMKQDNEEKFFNFDRALMINPAIDLNHGVATLDGFYNSGNKLTADQKDWIMGSIIDPGGWLMGQQLTAQNITIAASMIPPFTVANRAWVVGNSFRQDLRDVIYATQQVHDSGMLKHKATNHHRNARLDEAATVSFARYIEYVVLPSLDKDQFKGKTVEEVISTGGLYTLLDLLKNDSRIYMQENADDFLLKAGDAELLKNTMGDRFYLYPHGGHCGAVWFPKNDNDFHEIMTLKK